MASDPRRNLEFYTRVLGLRLVKQTVNFDDPGVYHFYFGDHRGSPGSILTFFPWPTMARGRRGVGEVSATAYACPMGGARAWSDRLRGFGIESRPFVRLGQPGIAFEDHDGMRLEIVESADVVGAGGAASLGGFHSVTLAVRDAGDVARRLEAVFGVTMAGEEAGRVRLRTAGTQMVDLIEDGAGMAKLGAGSVHHVALRAADEADQHARGDRARRSSLTPTPVADRQYFKSIYFRDHSGVLFEVATDGPGFAVDEPEDQLGSSLRLPPMFEPSRAKIIARLPLLSVPEGRSTSRGDLALHRHHYEKAEPAAGGVVAAEQRTLLLLHGTGGDELDLLPLGRRAAPTSNLLSPRGNVSEQGAARFFRRFAEGVFDEADAAHRSAELARWLVAARAEYGIGTGTLDALGYSNGANTLGAMLLLGELGGVGGGGVARRQVLLRAMPVFAGATQEERRGVQSLRGVRVLMISGERDTIVPPEGARALAARLGAMGAQVEVTMLRAGHELTRDDIEISRAFFEART